MFLPVRRERMLKVTTSTTPGTIHQGVPNLIRLSTRWQFARHACRPALCVTFWQRVDWVDLVDDRGWFETAERIGAESFRTTLLQHDRKRFLELFHMQLNKFSPSKLGWRKLGIGGFALAGFAIWAVIPKAESLSVDRSNEDPTVAVAKPSQERLSDSITLQAEFRPYQDILVHAKVSGYVRTINVDIGDHVTAGQVLATLEIPELRDNLRKANAALITSQEEVKRLEANQREAHLVYQRLGSVAKDHPNLVAQQDLDDAEAKDAAAQGELGAAQSHIEECKAEVGRIGALVDYSRITAPFNGIVTKRFADLGALIQAGTASDTQAMPLVELAEDDLLRLQFPVPESQAAIASNGRPIAIKVPSLNQSLSGKITRSAWNIDRSTRTMTTEVDVPNVDGKLHAGMYASIQLPIREESALSVPVQALSIGLNPTILVLNKDQQLEERSVKVGMKTATRAAILSGLNQDELVVLGDRSALHSGEKVIGKIVDLPTIPGAQEDNG
jgi:RND family efflux transporter MFP subunit